MRMLLVSIKTPQFPNVPMLSELGYKQELVSTWFATYAPSGLPEEVQKVLVPAVEKAIKNPESKAKIEQMKFIVYYKSPAEMKKRVVEEYERAVQIADRVGLRKKLNWMGTSKFGCCPIFH
jgi:tripartite-type tricarboxylate transporter receptor subunit TctC